MNSSIRHLVIYPTFLILWLFVRYGYASDCSEKLSSKSTVNDLLACIADISTEISSLKKEAQSLKIPSDAIIAFDRREGCPPGWEPFSAANGRTIIGAATAEYSHLSKLQKRPFRATGGSEEHTLVVEEIPRHNHDLRGLLDGGPLPWGHNTKHFVPIVQASVKYDWYNGGGKPHNNMPPYIALFFCKKL